MIEEDPINELLQFMVGILPLIEEEFDPNDPDKIGPKTSRYILEKTELS